MIKLTGKSTGFQIVSHSKVNRILAGTTALSPPAGKDGAGTITAGTVTRTPIGTPLEIENAGTPQNRVINFKVPLPDNNAGAHFGDSYIVNTNYISSKASGLVTNSTGMLGNNYNFSDLTFDPTETTQGKGSFYWEGLVKYYYSDESIAVNPDKLYKLEVDLRQDSVAGDFSSFTVTGQKHRNYIGLTCYDVDGLLIKAQNTMFVPGTHTVLTAPLTPGDTQIHVSDASNWNNDNSVSSFFRALSIWEYKNSYGFKYDDYTTYYQYSLWLAGGIVGNTINLRAPLAGFMGNPDHPNGTWPVGTKVSNGASGGTYKYTLYAGGFLDELDTWYKLESYIGGVDKTGSNHEVNFPPATAFIKLFAILAHSNRSPAVDGSPTTPNTKIRISGFQVKELEYGASLPNGELRVLEPNADASEINWVLKDGASARSIREIG